MDQERSIHTDSLPRFIPSGVEGARSRGILIFIWGFIVSVFVSSFVFISPLVSIFLVLVAIAILIAEKIYRNEIVQEIILLCVAIIAIGLGSFRYAIKDFHEPVIPSSVGVVISEPEQRENTTRFVMLADNGEKVLVNTELYSEVTYGDKIKINGTLQKPGLIDDGVGRPFDYAKYLSKDDIYFLMNFAEVEIISHGHGNVFKSFLFGVKQSLVAKMREIFAELESSLLAGLILAGKSAMPKSILEEFRRAGIIHIVVLSGYNITIIADFMRRAFEKVFIHTRLRLSPKIPSMVSILGILLFVLMTGAEPTVVRASLMVLVVISAKMFRRTYSASRALLAAGLIMVLHNPKILVFDPSFQLSFLATTALIYVAPIFEKLLEKISDAWGLRTVLATTVSTQIVVLPLLVYSVGDISLVSLPANILVPFFIPVVMFTGFIATLAAYVSNLLALPLSYFSHLILSWILGVASFMGNISFATINAGSISIWLVALAYFAMIIAVWRLRNFVRKPASSN